MKTVFLLSFLFFSKLLFAVEPLLYTTQKDRALFDDYIKNVATKDYTPGELIIATSLYFLDTPYVGATLEKEPEGLVVNLRELDCTTFVETVFALSKTVLEGEHTFDSYCRNLQSFRYRDGKVNGYISRLHYTTDWIVENERKSLTKDITKEIGGEILPVSVSFMSRNADKYRQLKDNPDEIAKISTIEDEINKRTYYYIPENRIDSSSDKVQDGDMVCFVTSISGLDISHVGIAHRVDGKLTFIHASSSSKRVIVEPHTMQEYTQAISKNKGVIIVRPQF